MKNFYFTLSLILVCIATGFSQVGIGTTTPASGSILDITSADKGILIPRMDLGNLALAFPVSNPEKSLLVFNTDAGNNGVAEGFYYWSGAAWTPLSGSGGSSGGGSGSADSWSLDGNSISGPKFIGTTNFTNLVFKVNNSVVTTFSPHGGVSFGINAVANTNNSIAIGRNANASTTNEATAIGPYARATGFQSAAFGNNANATNNSALALGHLATASGHQSAALGYNAKAINNNSTLALGNSATASSFQATAIGVNARANTNNNALAIGTNTEARGENSTAIGTNARTTQNNAIVLGDANNANVGIGTSTPNTNTKLDVNGNYKLGQRGTVQKNMISFSVGRNYTVAPNSSAIIQIDLPLNQRPSTTNVSVVVTPENGFHDDLHIVWTKLNGTNTLRMKIVNTGGNIFNGSYSNFHITFIEF